MDNIRIIRSGDHGQVWLPRSCEWREDTRSFLRSRGGYRSEEEIGYWTVPWQDAVDFAHWCTSKGWNVSLHGGARGRKEEEERQDVLWAKAAGKIAALPQPIDKYTKEKIEGIRWLLTDGNKLLADDCGFGKAVQAIVAASVLEESK